MPKHVSFSNPKSTFVSVNQCRFCGAIVPFSNGGERHAENFRFLKKITSNGKFQAMISVNFPCPLVIIKKHIPSPSASTTPKKTDYRQENNEDSVHLQSRRKSSLRALENLRRLSSTNEDSDQDVELSEDDEQDITTDTESESDSDGAIKAIPKEQKTPSSSSTGNEKYPCPYKNCGSKLHSAYKLKEHFLLHLENSPFACPYSGCDRKMSGRWDFQVHMDWHTGKNLKSCEKCGRIFSKRKRKKWDKHVCKSSYGKRKGVPAGFLDAGQYSRYLKGKNSDSNHDRDKAAVEEILRIQKTKSYNEIIASDPAFMEVCKDNPGFKELILKDGRGRKLANSERYKCSKCDKCYSKMYLLKHHILLSHTNRPWRCSKCERTFLEEQHLKSHMNRIHRPRSSNSLNDMYMHREENGDWSCKKCGFQTKYDASMRRHWHLKHEIEIPPLKKSSKAERNNSRKKSNSAGKKNSKKEVHESSSESENDSEGEHKALRVRDKCKQTDFPSSAVKVKMESEPVLELVMIKAEDGEVDFNVVKQEDL